jgi:hypothetical protein
MEFPMSDPLTTYLQDHLAGSIQAIELLKAIREHQAGESLGEFAAHLLVEIESDRDVLATLVESLGGSVGGPKEWSAWIAEKVSRLKLKHGSGDDLGTFEALEFLVLGIHGKWALWRALTVVAVSDSRLDGANFGELTTRAESQHARVDAQRLARARGALCPES